MKAVHVLVWLAALVCGCASHYQLCEPRTLLQSGLVDDPKQVSRIEKAMTDNDIAMLLDADIRAKLPTKLAVAAVGEYPMGSGAYYSRRHMWRRHELPSYGDVGGYAVRCDVGTISADELAGWEDAIKGTSSILGVHPISPLVLGAGSANLRHLRVAAARMNCELLLVYLRSDSCVDNYNDAAALYWTFVGLWLVPGNVYEHKTVIQAVVMDCRTGAVLGTATGDSHLRRACPTAYGGVQRGKLAQEAPRKAMAALQKACKPLLREVAAAGLRKGH